MTQSKRFAEPQPWIPPLSKGIHTILRIFKPPAFTLQLMTARDFQLMKRASVQSRSLLGRR